PSKRKKNGLKCASGSASEYPLCCLSLHFGDSHKRPLHEQFHIIRLNMAAAALVASVSFCLSGFLYENEEVCRILSILIHMFYTSTGLWLAAEAHALFSALVIGSFGSKLTLHVMVAWGRCIGHSKGSLT
ncbi:uncharacterized protein CEXT_649901, partial [Caerostris extrusa]